jgi:hypothetical protein
VIPLTISDATMNLTFSDSGQRKVIVIKEIIGLPSKIRILAFLLSKGHDQEYGQIAFLGTEIWPSDEPNVSSQLCLIEPGQSGFQTAFPRFPSTQLKYESLCDCRDNNLNFWKEMRKAMQIQLFSAAVSARSASL